MLTVLFVGTSASGKTHLLRQCYRNLTQHHDIDDRDDVTEYSSETSKSLPSVLEMTPKKNNTTFLAQTLARRTVPAVVVAMPKSTPEFPTTKDIVRFARNNCPEAQIALIVTKSDASYNRSEHEFDSMVFDTMQAAEGVQRLFYTSALQGRGISDLRSWVDDAVLSHTSGEDYAYFGSANTALKRNKYKFRKLKPPRGCTATDGCDSCTLQ